MADEAVSTEFEDALERQRLDADSDGGIFTITQGRGVSAREIQLDPRPLFEELPDDDHARYRRMAGFVRGVKHALLEPQRSDADQWDFVESAGGLVPSLEIPTFSAGVEAATGNRAWTLDFDGDLVVSYFIQLDRGLRVLTDAQVQRWGVSDDRITSGARSRLFHETRDLDFTPFDDGDHVHRLHAGDGHDAARCFVVGDAFYTEIDDEFRFAVPTPDHFLCVFEDRSETVEELSRIARNTYHETDVPLSPELFEFELSNPVISQEYADE